MTKQKISLAKDMEYFKFVAIPLLIYLVFLVWPNISIFYYSLVKWNGMSPDMKFIGLQNYVFLFNSDRAFPMALKNTILYSITVVLGQNIPALLLAMLVARQAKANNFFRVIFFLPAIFSTVTVGFIWGFIYDPSFGILNDLFKVLGLESLIRVWLADSQVAIFSVAAVHVWCGIGYGVILFLAGLKNIPNELYESADIEGVGPWSRFTKITFPLLRPTTIIVLVLTTIGCFKAFDYVYILTKGGAGYTSEVLATLLYREGFKNGRVGYSAAVSVILLTIVFVIAIIQLKVLKEGD